MSDKSLATRLAIKPGQTVHLMRAPPQFSKALGRLPAGAQIVEKKAADRVIVFAGTAEELDEILPDAMAATQSDGALWVAYPKIASGKSDLSRQAVHDKMRLAGWKPVAQIAVDDVWSAIRGRPASAAERRRI